MNVIVDTLFELETWIVASSLRTERKHPKASANSALAS